MAATAGESEVAEGYTHQERFPGTRIQDVNGRLRPALTNLSSLLFTIDFLADRPNSATPVTDVLWANPMINLAHPHFIGPDHAETVYRATVRTLAALDGDGSDLSRFGFGPEECAAAGELMMGALIDCDFAEGSPTTAELVAAFRATHPQDAEASFALIRKRLFDLCAGATTFESQLRVARRYGELAEALALPERMTPGRRLRIMRDMIGVAASFHAEGAPPPRWNERYG